MAITTTTRRVNYPESDGKPMGETEHHKRAIWRIMDILARYYADQPVHVSGDLLLFYEQGNPKKFVVPDVFTARTPNKSLRRNFKIWEEECVPNVVVEVTSKKTRKRDQIEKPALYRALGVSEYFLFDPLGEYLETPLIGYRLEDGDYQRIPFDATGSLMSEELGLQLRIDDDLEFYLPNTQVRLLDSKEDCELKGRLAIQAKAKLDQEQARAAEALARAEEQRVRAEEQQARADAALARIAKLEAELARVRS